MSKTVSVFDVQQNNFQTAVIDRSHETLVLVDFWAPWCGPCRMLGPVLERLANAPDSHFVLAKLNTDQNQQLAMQYDIRGIPAVKAFRNGRVVDEFVGAQPEPNVRQFIQRNTAAPQAAPKPSGDPLSQAKAYLRDGRGCEAQSLLQNIEAAEAQPLKPLAQFLCQLAQGQNLSGRADLDNTYRDALSELQRRHPETAMYRLLTALNQEAAGRRAAVKAAMHGLVALWGGEKPAVAQYKQILADLKG